MAGPGDTVRVAMPGTAEEVASATAGPVELVAATGRSIAPGGPPDGTALTVAAPELVMDVLLSIASVAAAVGTKEGAADASRSRESFFHMQEGCWRRQRWQTCHSSEHHIFEFEENT